MTDFTKGKVSDIPEVNQHRPRGGWGLTQALRDLSGEDALFIYAKDGEELHETQTRASTVAGVARGPGTLSTRRDHERNGVWVFLRNGGSA